MLPLPLVLQFEAEPPSQPPPPPASCAKWGVVGLQPLLRGAWLPALSSCSSTRPATPKCPVPMSSGLFTVSDTQQRGMWEGGTDLSVPVGLCVPFALGPGGATGGVGH